MGRLNHGRIKALDSPGLHGDGDTLYLRVAPGGSKSWIQRVAVNGWRRDIGLGGWPVVPLARARQRAFTNRVAISEGRDPLAEKRVPLSDAALAVLERVLPLRDSSDLVFPSVRGRELSNMTLTKCLRTAGIDAVPHGFRTSFRTWTSEQTSAPHAVAEMALAHAVGSAVERSYARSDLFEKRRGLMDRWAAYVTGRGTAEPSLSGSGRGAVSVLSPQAAARV